MATRINAVIVPDGDRWAASIPPLDRLRPVHLLAAIRTALADARAAGAGMLRNPRAQGLQIALSNALAWADDADAAEAAGYRPAPALLARVRSDVVRWGRELYGLMAPASSMGDAGVGLSWQDATSVASPGLLALLAVGVLWLLGRHR